jgi:hypothetical protein
MVVGGSRVVVVGGVVEVVSSGMSWLRMLCDGVVVMMMNGRLIRWVYVCVDVCTLSVKFPRSCSSSCRRL